MQFYCVNPDSFKIDKAYSFRIFLYDTQSKSRITSVYENVVFTNEKKTEIFEYSKKGAKIQVHFCDLDDFYLETESDQADLEKFNYEFFKCKIEKERREEKYQNLVEDAFNLKDEMEKASSSNNFMEFINRAKSEILLFDLDKSHTVSTTTAIVEKIFSKDILPVRAASFAYFLAKANKIHDQETLCNIVLACLCKDFGHHMLNKDIFEQEDMVDDSLYLKHPMLSIYVLSKASIEFNDDIKRYVLEHHEQSDGSGFPRGKKENLIDFNSFIINLAHTIIEYHRKNHNNDLNLLKILSLFQKKSELTGVNMNYPENLLESLIQFIKLES